MKKLLLVAVVLCFSFIKSQAQTGTILVPLGYANGECDIARSFGGVSVFSSIDTDISSAAADNYYLVDTYVDIYITDEDGEEEPEHLFSELGSSTNTTPLTSAYTSVSTVHPMTFGHTYNIQYEYYAKYTDLNYTGAPAYIEYGESSADVNN